MYPDKIEFITEQSLSSLVLDSPTIKLLFSSFEDSLVLDQKVDYQLTFYPTQSINKLEIKQNINEFIIISPQTNFSPTITVNSLEETRVFTSSQDINKYNCVSIDIENFTVSKTSLEPNKYRKYLGLSLETVSAGSPINVKISGIIYDQNWNWDPDLDLWCGENATITQHPHNVTGLVSLKVAEVLTPNMIVVSRFEPILL